MGIKLGYDDKGRLDDRLFELRRLTVNGTRDHGRVMDALQALIEGRKLSAAQIASVQPFYPVRDYGRYDQYLRPLDEQMELLRDLNRRVPSELRISDAWLDVDTTSDHVQGVENLEHWFIWLDTLEKTWAFNQELVRLTQPAIYDSGFDRSARAMRLNRLAHQYEPGVHKVNLNLVDNWDPSPGGRNVDTVRNRAAAVGKELAAVEPLGAYALQDPKLYQLQDGENLPYFDCAGLEQGDAFGHVPVSRWYRIYRRVYFYSYPSDGAHRVCAAPSRVAQGVL